MSEIDIPTPQKPLARRWWILGQRRTFLVDWRSQLRLTLLAMTTVGLLLAALIVSLHVSRARSTEILVAKIPALAELLEEQDRTTLYLQLAAAGVFLAMVAGVSVLETHKTAGAAFNLSRNMARLRDDESGTRVTLRQGDNLQALARAFNEMSLALDERRFRDAEAFRNLAEQAEQISDPYEARQLAETLREYARERDAGSEPAAQERSSRPDPASGEETASEAAQS